MASSNSLLYTPPWCSGCHAYLSVCRASFEFQPGCFLSELLSKCGSVADMRTEAVGSFRVCPELDLTYVDIQTEGHCLYFTLDIAQNLLCSF